jgi:UrcA family protein
MTKGKIALLGSAMALLLCGAGSAGAQDYYGGGYGPGYGPAPSYGPGPGYQDRESTESVIVTPDYDEIQQQQLIGHINGEVNPQAYTISRPVNFSDLNLDRHDDRVELRIRVEQTAQDMCAELDNRVPGLAGYPSADRECVQKATRNAMREAMARYYG